MSASFFSQTDPLEHFKNLYQVVEQKVSKDPNAMQLATVDSSGQPSIRTVLLKGTSPDGFLFFTNYDSRKGREIGISEKVALHFYWPSLDQQIRIEGMVEKVSAADSDSYFASRPRLSQIGAWASEQSEKIPDIQFLKNKVAQIEEKFKDKVVDRPPHWGGYLVRPLRMEFWFAREGRLHERFVYQRQNIQGTWQTFMLSP
jgi:pyridoxamine 5'-phosphate oxidase